MKTSRTIPVSREEKKRRAELDKRPRTTISWYRYVNVADPDEFKQRLEEAFSNWDCFGRIYVAYEGINAQMNVPTKYWHQFDAWVQKQPELSGVPYKFAVEEKDLPSFYKLTVKIRPKIVADGLDDTSFNVTDTGEYLTPEEMNAYIDDEEAVVVDMRNGYESEVGYFENAITPTVETFREELQTVPELLRVHKNKKIALYCTGGIRCEKASAWLKHNGFNNVRHLKGGIIEYARQVKEQGLTNKFKGKNFVFDERLGEKISDDVVSICHLCRSRKSDTHYHCANQVCHTLYIGCDECVKARKGYCSIFCNLTDRLPSPVRVYWASYYNRVMRRRPFKKTRLRSISR